MRPRYTVLCSGKTAYNTLVQLLKRRHAPLFADVARLFIHVQEARVKWLNRQNLVAIFWLLVCLLAFVGLVYLGLIIPQ